MKERPAQRDGDGVLFPNQKKETEKHPDMTGSLTLGGKQYWLAGWKRESKAGNKYMSIAATPKELHAPRAKPEFEEDAF